MGTYENFYLKQIKQLQEENKKLKQMINQLNINEGGSAATELALDALSIPSMFTGGLARRSRRLRDEYAKPLDDQEEMQDTKFTIGPEPTGKTREGKGYLGSPEDIDRRNKAAQRRAADEQKMKDAGFYDSRYGPYESGYRKPN
jgi:hypothetical protein